MGASTWGGCRRLAGVVAIAPLVLAIDLNAPDAHASCVAPVLTLDHTSGAIGEEVEIRGQYFGTGCNDVQIDGTFAGPPLGEPQTGITLVIVQDDQVIPLGVIDADDNYEFGVRLAIPTQLDIGPATIRVALPASSAASTSFTVTNVSANTDMTSTTTVLLTSTTIEPAASTVHASSSTALLGSTSGSSTVPSDASNGLAPWAWGLIGLGFVAALALVASSRARTRRRTR